MDIIQFLLLEIALPLGIVALLHFKIGTYPQSLSLEGNKRQGIWEVLIFWALLMIVSTGMIALLGFAEKMATPTQRISFNNSNDFL